MSDECKECGQYGYECKCIATTILEALSRRQENIPEIPIDDITMECILNYYYQAWMLDQSKKPES